MALPESAKVVVIGAGVHGLSTSWHLATELEARGLGSGADVVVLGQDRRRGGPVGSRLRGDPQQLLPARDARADGAFGPGLGVRPRGVPLPPGGLPAGRTRGDARGRRDDPRAAARDRLHLRPHRGRGRVPRVHGVDLPRLAGEERVGRLAREEGRLRREHAVDARAAGQGRGARGSSDRAGHGGRVRVRRRRDLQGRHRPGRLRLRAGRGGRGAVGARRLAHARPTGDGDGQGTGRPGPRTADVDLLVPGRGDARRRPVVPPGQRRQPAAGRPLGHRCPAPGRHRRFARDRRAVGHLLQA